MIEEALQAALNRFREELGTKSPAMRELLRRIHDAEMSPEQAVREVWIAAGENSAFAQEVEEILLHSFGVTPSSALATLPDRDQLLNRWGFREEDLIYQPHPDRPTRMLHPLLMGAIVELLQFDGDVPELRTGSLPEGGAPAVPVRTEARDPVVVGFQLRRARDQVARELAAAQHEHNAKVAALAEIVGNTNAAASIMLRRESDHAVSIPGSQPGHTAALRSVEEPTGADLAGLEFRERQQLVHLTLTSTQGRRSVAPVISGMLLEGLHADGYRGIKLGDEGDVSAEFEWALQIDGSSAERNPRFNFIEVAGRALLSKMRKHLSGKTGPYTRYALQVLPISEIADRVVGWRAVLRE
jgi:hypothetical protein